MRLRDARPEDLNRLLELYSPLEGPNTEGKALAGSEAGNIFTRLLIDPNQETLIAEGYDETVGTLVMAVLPNPVHGGKPYAVVENVAVDKERRREGIGAALMREAVERAREARAYKLALCSKLEREEFHSLYRSRFEVTP